MKMGDLPVASSKCNLDLGIVVGPVAVGAVAKHFTEEIQVEQRVGEPRPLPWRGQRENVPRRLSAKRSQQTAPVRLQPRWRQPQIVRVDLSSWRFQYRSQ